MAKQRARVTDDTTESIIRASILDEILNMPDLDEVPMLLVPIDLIDPNPYQTRRYFDPEKLEELAAAMRANGFLGSLVARQVEGRYQLAYGERRLRAARLAQIGQIPLNVADFSDMQMMEVAVTENVNREDLTPVEEAEAYQLLSDAGYSYRKISERVGKSVGHISKSLALLKQDDVKEAVEQARIKPTEAYEISRVENPEARQALIDQVAGGQLDRASLTEAIRRAQAEPDVSEATSTSTQRSSGASRQRAPVLQVYDPAPNLIAAVKQLRTVRPDLFRNIPVYRRRDLLTQLEEIISRAQDYLTSLRKLPVEAAEEEVDPDD